MDHLFNIIKIAIFKFKEYYHWYYGIVRYPSYREVKFHHKFFVWSKGFKADQFIQYDFEHNNYKEYINEMEKFRIRKIHKGYEFILDNKIILNELLKGHVKVAKNLAIIINGKIVDFDSKRLKFSDVKYILDEAKALLLKPIDSHSGIGVHLLRLVKKEYWFDNTKIQLNDLYQKICTLNNYLLSEYIQQHNYANKIYPNTLNTIRIITLQDKDTHQFSIPVSIHRFGSDQSFPVDNSGSGGVYSKIDVDSGILGVARSNFEDKVYTDHPVTHVKIEGVSIPDWNNVKQKCIELAMRFPFLYFIAWDIALTDEGVCVIEGNASTGLDMIQRWNGERNTQLGRFLKKMGVLHK